jgi:hypothetical protein
MCDRLESVAGIRIFAMTRQECHSEFNKAGSLLFSLNIHDGITSIKVVPSHDHTVEIHLDWSAFEKAFKGQRSQTHLFMGTEHHKIFRENVQFNAMRKAAEVLEVESII